MQHSISLLKYYAPTAEGKIELARPYFHRKRRQYKIRHSFDPKMKKSWQKNRRKARQYRK